MGAQLAGSHAVESVRATVEQVDGGDTESSGTLMANVLQIRDVAEVDLPAQVRAALDASVAPSTRKAYRSDWNDFTAWCADLRLGPKTGGLSQ